MDFSHLDEKGNARMADISEKEITKREAVAVGKVRMSSETVSRIMDKNMPKGDVLTTARLAGIMGAKNTASIIPLCHTLPLDSVKIDLSPDIENQCIDIKATAICSWKTGVEMEALTAVSVAALTIYDMCKAVDKSMVISDICLIKKTGGKSGDFERKI